MSGPWLSRANDTPTALLLIDIQRGLNTSNGYYGTERSTPGFEENIERLLSGARKHNDSNPERPVFIEHVYHESSDPRSPLYPGSNVYRGDSEFQAIAKPNASSPHEAVFSKRKNSAFIDTALESDLRDKRVKQLIIMGMATDHCVSTSTRMACDLGVVEHNGLVIVSDATAAFNKGRFDAETVHQVNLASLDGEFAKVLNTRQVLNELLGET